MLFKIPSGTKVSDNNINLIKERNQNNKYERQYIRQNTKVENYIREPRIKKENTKSAL
jgi:hypothetical protein